MADCFEQLQIILKTGRITEETGFQIKNLLLWRQSKDSQKPNELCYC